MSLSITHGHGKPWALTGFLWSDGTYRRLVAPSRLTHPSGRGEPQGFVLEGFIGEREADVWELILQPQRVVGLHPLMRRRLNDPRRLHGSPSWSWVDPIMAVIGQPSERDVLVARRLKAQAHGLLD